MLRGTAAAGERDGQKEKEGVSVASFRFWGIDNGRGGESSLFRIPMCAYVCVCVSVRVHVKVL